MPIQMFREGATNIFTLNPGSSLGKGKAQTPRGDAGFGLHVGYRGGGFDLVGAGIAYPFFPDLGAVTYTLSVRWRL